MEDWLQLIKIVWYDSGEKNSFLMWSRRSDQRLDIRSEFPTLSKKRIIETIHGKHSCSACIAFNAVGEMSPDQMNKVVI